MRAAGEPQRWPDRKPGSLALTVAAMLVVDASGLGGDEVSGACLWRGVSSVRGQQVSVERWWADEAPALTSRACRAGTSSRDRGVDQTAGQQRAGAGGRRAALLVAAGGASSAAQRERWPDKENGFSDLTVGAAVVGIAFRLLVAWPPDRASAVACAWARDRQVPFGS